MSTKNSIFLLLVVWLGVGCASAFERRAADEIIAKVDNYVAENGTVPDPADIDLMASLGFELAIGWVPDYQPLSPTTYRITLLEGFDGPYWVYDSADAQWRYTTPSPLPES